MPIIGANCLTSKELETTLIEVEACINSRPLTFLGDAVDASNPLTPSHFLIGRSAGFQPEVSVDSNLSVSASDLCAREVIRQARLDEFWSKWSDDYLRNLPPTVKGFAARCNLKRGSVVLVREDNVCRLSWPLAVVIDLFPGKDGVVRSVKLKTSKGIVIRSIQRLHDLEINDQSVECVSNSVGDNLRETKSENNSGPIITTTRFGRVVKQPVKLDL